MILGGKCRYDMQRGKAWLRGGGQMTLPTPYPPPQESLIAVLQEKVILEYFISSRDGPKTVENSASRLQLSISTQEND